MQKRKGGNGKHGPACARSPSSAWCRHCVGGNFIAASQHRAGAGPEHARRQHTAAIHARRRLGTLEVSAVGLGVQNMSRTYQQTIPTRSEMFNIIRTAFDRGVTFYDAAEAYGPHEVKRILGEGVAAFRDQVAIATKFGWNIALETGVRRPGLNSRPEHIKRVVEGMLKRLRTASIFWSFRAQKRPRSPEGSKATLV